MKSQFPRTKFSLVVLLLFFHIFINVTPLDLSRDSIIEKIVPTSGMSGVGGDQGITDNIKRPLQQLQSFQTPSILFLVGDDTSLDTEYDIPFYDYMNTDLGFSVMYHTANDSYNYTDYDAIVISRSVAEEGTVETLIAAPIPILTMEPGHGDEFSFGIGTYGTKWFQNAAIPLESDTASSINHYILENEIPGSEKQIFSDFPYSGYLKGYTSISYPSGCEIKRLAYPASDPKYSIISTLDKGHLDWNLQPAPERRIFWGMYETSTFLSTTWSWWEKALYWTLYDDSPGNATIDINVKDVQNQDIINAEVELINSNNLSISWTENTSQSGLVTFTNVSWGEYDIKARFRTEENSSLSNLQVAPSRTYITSYFFAYSVSINVSVDETAPEIDQVYFDNSTSTFFAHVTDFSPLSYVLLNLTAFNNFNDTIVIPVTEFIMLEGTGNNYFNATSLSSLSGIFTNITVTYNIIAEDIAGNNFASIIQSFVLDDPIAPHIWSYGAQDFGNGTVGFTANITDENGVQAPVILDINGIHYEMYLEESTFWEFRGLFDYNVTLNYTIYSTSDSVGNSNGSFYNPGLFPTKNITTSDTTPPRLSALSDSFTHHDKGFVEFSVQVDDWSIDHHLYQSGVNSSNVNIILEINGENSTFKMDRIGEVTFVFDYTFNYNDNISYWIQAYDNASNSVISSPQPFGQPIRINDNSFPSLSFSAIEYGNGTIDFFAQVIDWPNNDTDAHIYFTDDYFAAEWTNESMIGISSSNFHYRVLNFPYQTQAIWYSVNAVDSENNLYTTPIESAKSLQLTDLVVPEIELTYMNSTLIDGEITIVANAIDPYGPVYLLNNSICLNISSSQGTISINMTFDSGTTYIFSRSYQDQTELNITGCVSDINGNTGYSSFIILVADKSPPTIMQSGIESFSNDTLTIFIEVVEGINGSGLLDDNSSITLNYVYKTPFYETMVWNGSGNYFSYPIPGLNPNDAVFYRFLIIDKANNTVVTDWEQFFIADTFAPIIIDFNATETQKSHISTEINFWTNSRDEFGDIAQVIVNYSILTDQGWSNFSQLLSQVYQDYYEKRINFLPNSTIRYQIIVIDTFNNTAKTEYINMTLSGFNPSQFGEGDYGFDIDNPGKVIVWIVVIDNFDIHSHNVTITVTDRNTSKIVLNNSAMTQNNLNYSISFEIDYLHQFSYSLVLIDQGVLHGYYDKATRNSTILKMEDNWCPTIHGAGFKKNSDSTYLFWANITDWGSGENPNDLDVFLNYSLEIVTGGGSELSTTYNQEKMTFNGTLFEASITFHDSGTLKWLILASDSFSSSDSYSGADTPIVLEQLSGGIDIEWIIAAVIFTSVAFLVIISSIMTIRRRRTKTLTRKQTFVEKLNFLSNIYTIMVSSSVGVPIWSITNVLYKSDDSMNGTLSGLSVGIDSFLESFQSDFLAQVQGSLSQSDAQIDGNIKLSVIEQNKVQILILGSTAYRIFVFLKEIPSKFIRETFLEIVKEMEINLPLQDFGIIDENIQGPLVKSVVRKYLPVDLLETFKIDLDRLADIDERLKTEKTVSGMTRVGVNVLKILSISNIALSDSKKLNRQALMKLFNQAHLSESQIYSGTHLYRDAVNILNRLADFTPEELYEAFWLGIDKEVKILIPSDSV